MPTQKKSPQQALIQLLQMAYSGELAAANAYRGHWQSVKNPKEKAEIFQIEIEELIHRKEVGEILVVLEAKPKPLREIGMNLLGRMIGLLCLFGGWFIPMYGAGKLEHKNILEYEEAARYAWLSKNSNFIEPLLAMAELEANHEAYFYEKVQNHWLSRWFPAWRSADFNPQIRQGFEQFCQAHSASNSTANQSQSIIPPQNPEEPPF